MKNRLYFIDYIRVFVFCCLSYFIYALYEYVIKRNKL